MEIWFSHGKESGPWGRKITHLAAVARELGHTVVSVDYRHTEDPDERVRHLIAQSPPRGDSLVLVGSSMGGYVAAAASAALRPAGLFLMAPALYLPGYEGDVTPHARAVAVIHGWGDELIPPAHSMHYAEAYRAALHVLDSDHGLADAVDDIAALFERFVIRLSAG
ncbi:alpha/beta fold hydrolase [Arhodomonas sp. SL1]|uniref:alpha/beta fold hydrolase n=1 Tax=Arhodomonas sp. SL1 TaxID=3425691 RepID=UPI003F8821C4